jgi:hypothetical protein
MQVIYDYLISTKKELGHKFHYTTIDILHNRLTRKEGKSL